MQCSPSGQAFIKFYEQCRLRGYNDGYGFWTIGWGHRDDTISSGSFWTQEQADIEFLKDLAAVEASVNSLVKVPLTQGQFDALCAFEFNCGVGALKYHDLLKYLNNNNYEAAADEFPRWCHSNGKMSAGLLKRGQAERAMFLGEQT